MWLMNMPMLLVSHPTTISIILKSSGTDNNFRDFLKYQDEALNCYKSKAAL